MSTPSDPPVTPVTPTVGNPLPMGALALMVATTGFGAVQLGWLPSDRVTQVAAGVLVLVVPLQWFSAVLGFVRHDPVVGSGMGVLAGSWAATALLSLLDPAHATHPALGVLLVCAGLALLVPAAAGTGKAVASLMLVTAAARFVVTGVYEATGDGAWKTAAGAVGLLLGVVALYTALAFELESAHQHAVLPTGR